MRLGFRSYHKYTILHRYRWWLFLLILGPTWGGNSTLWRGKFPPKRCLEKTLTSPVECVGRTTDGPGSLVRLFIIRLKGLYHHVEIFWLLDTQTFNDSIIHRDEDEMTKTIALDNIIIIIIMFGPFCDDDLPDNCPVREHTTEYVFISKRLSNHASNENECTNTTAIDG